MQEQIDAVQQIAQWPHCYKSRLQYTAVYSTQFPLPLKCPPRARIALLNQQAWRLLQCLRHYINFTWNIRSDLKKTITIGPQGCVIMYATCQTMLTVCSIIYLNLNNQRYSNSKLFWFLSFGPVQGRYPSTSLALRLLTACSWGHVLKQMRGHRTRTKQTVAEHFCFLRIIFYLPPERNT